MKIIMPFIKKKIIINELLEKFFRISNCLLRKAKQPIGLD